MKTAILVILMFFCGLYNQAYCQDINEKQSVENAKNAWASIFSNNQCVLLHRNNERYETNIYEMKSFKYDVVKTHSRANPYRLTVRIEIESWSSREKRVSIKDAFANVEEKRDRLPGRGTIEVPLTGVYKLKDGKWEFTMGNKWMMTFIKRARANYNTHVDISRVISIPEK